MQVRISTALFAFILTGLAPLHGQSQTNGDNTAGPIVTDRPTVTNSSVVVPSGSLQAENGFLETDRQGQDIADGPETLVRFGVATRTELRFYVPNYYYDLTAGGGPSSGFGDLAIGMKEQLGPTKGGFDVSATLFLSFPTGAVGVSSGGYDPGLQVAWSHGVSSKWTAAGMLSLYWPTVDHTHDLTGEFTILLDRQLAPTWDAIVEYVGDFPERGGSRQLLHFTTELRIGKQQHQQIDFQFGAGLTPATADHFIGIGYSFRFQAIHP
jgi:Putative MetA-pathway of phenol degradation